MPALISIIVLRTILKQTLIPCSFGGKEDWRNVPLLAPTNRCILRLLQSPLSGGAAMALLPSKEIESELSYAYLHAVASMAGMSCQVANRQSDRIGIDARIVAHGDFGAHTVLTDISLDIQLKATTQPYTIQHKQIPYFLHGVNRYDVLRRKTVTPQKILVVLFLPSDSSEWLVWSSERLCLQECAWWVSLRGAPTCDNTSGQTVYLPLEQHFNPGNLITIMTRLAAEEELSYHG